MVRFFLFPFFRLCWARLSFVLGKERKEGYILYFSTSINQHYIDSLTSPLFFPFFLLVGKDSWTGSIVEAETKNGRIKLEYIDEDPPESSGSGFFGRLFGGGGRS